MKSSKVKICQNVCFYPPNNSNFVKSPDEISPSMDRLWSKSDGVSLILSQFFILPPNSVKLGAVVYAKLCILFSDWSL